MLPRVEHGIDQPGGVSDARKARTLGSRQYAAREQRLQTPGLIEGIDKVK